MKLKSLRMMLFGGRKWFHNPGFKLADSQEGLHNGERTGTSVLLHANKDQTLQSKLQADKEVTDIVQLGKECGFNFTVDDMRTAMAEQQNPDSGELSNEALELVFEGVVIAIIAITDRQSSPRRATIAVKP